MRSVFGAAGSGRGFSTSNLSSGPSIPSLTVVETGDGHRRNPLSPQEESIRAAEIADRPVPVLKDNLRMGSADERIVDGKFAVFEAADFERFVESEVTP